LGCEFCTSTFSHGGVVCISNFNIPSECMVNGHLAYRVHTYEIIMMICMHYIALLPIGDITSHIPYIHHVDQVVKFGAS
jgi:hypothetical protein